MQEYIAMGHMVPADNLLEHEKLYYIPHHGVVKSDSLTTKMRVVFDASAKTSSGISLNECMHTGQKQQKDLMDILVKWRKHKIVFKADIAKMYRMINLDKSDQRYHTILWRESPTEKLKEYKLTTATFGTTAAPFMATRTLKALAEDVKDLYPLAEKVIKKDFYVDDMMSGSDNTSTALRIKDEVMKALSSGGMLLRKWSSNSQELLDSLPSELTEKSLQSFEDDTTKALGLQWNPRTDTFTFKIHEDAEGGTMTKRLFLSQASKVFDPLGWLAPVVINPKLMMQEIWESKINWDQEISAHLNEKWTQFKKELPLLSDVNLDRWIQYESNDKIQLHGFCDASEKAYAAVVYTRVEKSGIVKIRLVASKTRVAPVKTKLSLPRLELCGAVLLSNLIQTTKESLELEEVETIAWSDSMITLGWLQGSPSRWKTFVANRVSEVQNSKIDDWRYVPSEDNPADCASRGLMPSELVNFDLWWQGPKWLKQDPEMWPMEPIVITEAETKRVVVNAATVERCELLLEGSSWFKMTRVLAYVLRWKKNSPRGPLTVEEINKAKTLIYKQCQRESFAEEIEKLEKNEPVSRKSGLLQLNPFLDADGLLRVGGRLQNAIISYDNKHPIILPKGHHVTKTIIHQTHLDTLHGGPHMMAGIIRKKYWVIQGKRMINTEYKNCVNCRRMAGKTSHQIMGELPIERVTLERSFLHTGVDYAGPVEIRASRLRNAKILKAYIAVFVCFGTKAIHLELVSDVTTPAFMAALQRFVARRGIPEKLYSDNGANFVEARNELGRQEQQWFHKKNEELANLVINQGIAWKFIPPGAPNFGGLWERGVRSVKEHLKRTLKNSRLTFEEYNTVLCQIEGCLNSRPICPLTDQTENLNALTPGHLLIGDALMANPQPTILDVRTNQLNRWKHLQLLQQHFWTRWNNEYLNQLQSRSKWQKGEVLVSTGDLVLVKDEQLPPRHWLMGRITDAFPGKDNKVRVVKLQTRKGEIRRAIDKICPLISKEALHGQEQTQGISRAATEMPKEMDIPEPEKETDQEVEKHDMGPDVKEYDPDEPITLAKRTHTYNLRPKMPIVAVWNFIGVCRQSDNCSNSNDKIGQRQWRLL